MSILSKNPVGISVDEQSIEIVELVEKDGSTAVNSKVLVEFNPNLVENGKVKDAESLKKLIGDALSKAKPQPIKISRAVCALPAAYTFTGSIDVIGTSKSAIEKAVVKNIRDSVPLDYDKVVFSYRSISQKGSKKTLVPFIVSNKEVIESWQELFTSLSIRVVFDAKALAAYRALSDSDKSSSLCLVDMRDSAVDISIFSKGILHYSYSRSFIEDDTLISEVAKEVKLIVASIDQQKLKDYNVVVITGAGSKEDISKPLGEELGMKVKAAKLNVKNSKTASATTIGLALRDVDDKWEETDPRLSVENAVDLPKEENKTQNKKTEKDIREEIEEQKRVSKLKRQKIILLVLLVLVAAVLAFVYWFSVNNKPVDEDEVNNDNLIPVSEESSTTTEMTTATGTASTSPTTATTSTSTQTVSKQEVLLLIANTPTGWLNVRGGPGTSFEQVAKVNPGEVYKSTDRKDGWFEIELKSGARGWVFGDYVTLE